MNQFTRRELDIIPHLKRGETNKEIAHNLGLTLISVKKHMINIMKKLDDTNRTKAALVLNGISLEEKGL